MNAIKAMKTAITMGGMCTGLLMSSSVFAGAGANVYACVNLTTKPITPLSVAVTVGGSGTHCMIDSGSGGTLTASAIGLNCMSVGYVESKASSTKGDLCATDTSTWPMSYSISGSSYSGSMVSKWSTGNHISLTTSTKNTVVCNNKALCDSTSATWNSGTQGPLYIIFQPEAN